MFKKLENTAGKIHGNIIQLFICYDLDLKKKVMKICLKKLCEIVQRAKNSFKNITVGF